MTTPPSAATRDASPRVRRIIVLVGVALATFSWFFGFRPFLVNGVSMYPSFNASFAHPVGFSLISGDYLIIDIFSYLFLREPQRFDVVVARSPLEPGQHLLKRIVALPNEQVRLSDGTVVITTVEDETFTLREPYVNQAGVATYPDQVTRLDDGQYFLLGDNRTNSLDSRVWGGLTRDQIVGRVLLRLYPFSAVDWHPGSVDTTASRTLY